MKAPMKAKRPDPQPIHYCGECGHGVYDLKFANLDLEGKPTLVACPFFTFKHVRSERACAHFTPKIQ